MPSYNEPLICDLSEYQVVIKDLGMIDEENMDEFLSSNYCFLVLGAKDWELDYSEKCLKRFIDFKEIYYLFNFIDGKTFQKVMKSMSRQICYRVPYEVNPFGINKSNGMKELIDELLMDSIVFRNNARRKKQNYGRKKQNHRLKKRSRDDKMAIM